MLVRGQQLPEARAKLRRRQRLSQIFHNFTNNCHPIKFKKKKFFFRAPVESAESIVPRNLGGIPSPLSHPISKPSTHAGGFI